MGGLEGAVALKTWQQLDADGDLRHAILGWFAW